MDIWQNIIYCSSDQEFLFKKKVVESGETKTLSYQLSWIISKWWHTYSMKYFIISVFEKISEHKTKHDHIKALEKAKTFIMTFEDPTKAVTYDTHKNDKYQKNFQILKLINEAVLLCQEQEIAFRGYWEQPNYTESYHKKCVNTEKVVATINGFVKLDPILKDHLKNGAKMQKMTS